MRAVSVPSRSKHHYKTLFFPDKQGIPGAPDFEGRGLGYTQAWHGTNWASSPFLVPNEMIAGCIAQFLRLPIPPFAVTSWERGIYFFSSLDFNFDSEQLPPVIADICWKHLPKLCTGVVLFDIFIANEDRHDKNLVVDNQAKPKAMRIWDHDHALLGGGGKLRGSQRLQKLASRLGCTAGTKTGKGSNRHCLIDAIETVEHFGDWIARISAVPDWFIDDVCRSAKPYGLTAAEARNVAKFLKQRRNGFPELLNEHQREFSGIKEWKKPGGLF
jgi:hypothetical protein